MIPYWHGETETFSHLGLLTGRALALLQTNIIDMTNKQTVKQHKVLLKKQGDLDETKSLPFELNFIQNQIKELFGFFMRIWKGK